MWEEMLFPRALGSKDHSFPCSPNRRLGTGPSCLSLHTMTHHHTWKPPAPWGLCHLATVPHCTHPMWVIHHSSSPSPRLLKALALGCSPHLYPELTLVASVPTGMSHQIPWMLSSLISSMMTFSLSPLQPAKTYLAILWALSSPQTGLLLLLWNHKFSPAHSFCFAIFVMIKYT